MPGVIDQANAILSSAERRLEAAAQNIANVATPGFKRQVAFNRTLERCEAATPCPAETEIQADFKQGQLSETGSKFDLAVFGPGLFQLRAGDSLVYSRGGSFSLGNNGVLADAEGRALQQAGGGDLELSGGEIEILADGTVLEDGLPMARIALYEAPDEAGLRAAGGSTFLARSGELEEAHLSSIRQGFLERSNVTTSDEMVALMAAQREAESGGRLAQFYDQLMGQAIATFSRNSR